MSTQTEAVKVEELERRMHGLQRRLDILITEMAQARSTKAEMREMEARMDAKLEFLQAQLGWIAQVVDRRKEPR